MYKFVRCPACGCAVDEDLNGHHSEADCAILKYGEHKVATARAEALKEAAKKIRATVEGKNNPELQPEFGIYMRGVCDAVDEACAAILADEQGK